MVSFPNKGQTSCTLGSPLNFSVHESMCFEREIRTRKKGLEWVTGTRTKCVWGWRRKWHFFFLFFFSFFLFFPKVNGAESFWHASGKIIRGAPIYKLNKHSVRCTCVSIWAYVFFKQNKWFILPEVLKQPSLAKISIGGNTVYVYSLAVSLFWAQYPHTQAV